MLDCYNAICHHNPFLPADGLWDSRFIVYIAKFSAVQLHMRVQQLRMLQQAVSSTLMMMHETWV